MYWEGDPLRYLEHCHQSYTLRRVTNTRPCLFLRLLPNDSVRSCSLRSARVYSVESSLIDMFKQMHFAALVPRSALINSAPSGRDALIVCSNLFLSVMAKIGAYILNEAVRREGEREPPCGGDHSVKK